MRRGLVLEGGAMRGLFSVGVCDVLYEHGIVADGIIGVSAGAAFGCNYKSGQPGRALRYNKLMAKDRRYSSWGAFRKTGDIFTASFCYHYVPTHIDLFDSEAFEKSATEFYAVCTDVETGQAVYQRLDRGGHEMFEWIRASASMPVCSRIVEIGKQKLLDGGVADSIPLEYFNRIGYERNIVVLTQPLGYQKRLNSFYPIMRYSLRSYPNMVRAMRHRHKMYNRELLYVAQEEKARRAFVIRPPRALPIGHLCHKPEQMQQVYDIGRQTALDNIKQIEQFWAESV